MKKIGVLIVAYNAEKTISTVISRIHKDEWNNISEVFIFDDKSDDATSMEAEKERKCHPHKEKIKIFYNEINLGYGGNQKRGYLYAIKMNFDIVLLLHGDGQYPPELINDMVRPILEGHADAVFGSRMLKPNAALAGGMPLYKYIGNKILTKIQNIILSKNLSEYHSGYRAYSVESLMGIPFIENSNDFHFDTEIIIQLIEAKKRIVEIEIPTYYGDEICHVNGIKYAKNVLLSTLHYKLHKLGFLYTKKFDLKTSSKYIFKHNKYSIHNRIINNVSIYKKNGTALDAGCGAGFLAKHIKDAGYSVTGVDMYDSVEARAACDRFYIYDLNSGFGIKKDEKFDLIVFADILEHLYNPENTLIQCRKHLKQNGKIIASTGNIAHLYIRLCLLFGLFNYAERGILDRTHLHLFTIKTFKKISRLWVQNFKS